MLLIAVDHVNCNDSSCQANVVKYYLPIDAVECMHYQYLSIISDRNVRITVVAIIPLKTSPTSIKGISLQAWTASKNRSLPQNRVVQICLVLRVHEIEDIGGYCCTFYFF